MEKNTQIILWLVLLIAAIPFYVLTSLSSLGVVIVTIAYAVFGAIALVTLRYCESDEPYYININLLGLAASAVVAVVMVLIAVFFSYALNLTGLSTGAIVPISISQAIRDPNAIAVLAISAYPSSFGTSLVSDILYQFLVVSLIEQLMIFAAISGLRDATQETIALAHRKKKMAVYFALIAFSFGDPVIMWACWHSLESYSNWLLVIPAAINGFIMLLLIFVKKAGKVRFGIIASFFAHGCYNAYIVFSSYLNGTADLLNGLPLLPTNWNAADFYVMFFLLPLFLVLCVAVPVFMSRGDES
jgi:hypothetical protein